jgi:hypothetical protein
MRLPIHEYVPYTKISDSLADGSLVKSNIPFLQIIVPAEQRNACLPSIEWYGSDDEFGNRGATMFIPYEKPSLTVLEDWQVKGSLTSEQVPPVTHDQTDKFDSIPKIHCSVNLQDPGERKIYFTVVFNPDMGPMVSDLMGM